MFVAQRIYQLDSSTCSIDFFKNHFVWKNQYYDFQINFFSFTRFLPIWFQNGSKIVHWQWLCVIKVTTSSFSWLKSKLPSYTIISSRWTLRVDIDICWVFICVLKCFTDSRTLSRISNNDTKNSQDTGIAIAIFVHFIVWKR